MSDTPRVDTAFSARFSNDGDGWVLARTLERELGEATRANAVRVQIIKGLNGENAALREAQAEVFKIAMDCINGRISDLDALRLLEAQAVHSQGSSRNETAWGNVTCAACGAIKHGPHHRCEKRRGPYGGTSK